MTAAVLSLVNNLNCAHNKLQVDQKLGYVKCGLCGEQLNPIWALAQFCKKEARANREVERLLALAEKAEKKNRCKCQHCGKMTRIQR